MRRTYWSCGYCTHCGRSDKPLRTLSPIKGPGRIKHLCPTCYAAVAELAWIVDETAPWRTREQEQAWAP